MNKKVNSKSYEEILSLITERTIIPDDLQVIYQYTNIEALFNGIIVKEPTKNEEICLWASDYRYVNAPSEMSIAQKYVNEIFDEYFIEEKNNEIAINLISDTDYFITSFSTTIDSLPMWNMYGKNGSGIALGFNKDIVHNDNNPLYKCVYLDKKIREKIKSFCENYKGKKITKEDFHKGFCLIILASLFAFFKGKVKALDEIIALFQFVISTKDPAYKYENEIRLLIKSNKDSKIKYRCQNNLIIPYIENFFPKNALKEIWVGPTNDMERTIKSLRTYLDYMGFSDVEIIKSEVPYRI